MEDANLTASLVVSFSEKLEDATTEFYETLAHRFAVRSYRFAQAAQDAQKHKIWLVRTYQETISDALEACFCFQGMNLRHHEVDLTLPEDAGLPLALQMAIDLEEKAIAFYQEVAERSQSLLATIPAAFKRVAKRRAARKQQWEGLL
jgi:hypothetical protein